MFTSVESVEGGRMKVPTFYSTKLEGENVKTACYLCMFAVGGIFGGIHCLGWFFSFPSRGEGTLWRVSSAVLTGIAFLFPIFLSFVGFLVEKLNNKYYRERYSISVFTIILLVYVVSRILLLIEAFISVRHLTPRMLALVTWTSFIPHI